MYRQTGLSEAVLNKLIEALEHASVREIILFGSRAKGSFRQGSDIDICLDAPDMDTNELLKIKTEIDALDLPWMVDVVHKQSIDNPELLDHIRQHGLSLQSLRTAKRDSHGDKTASQ